MFDGQSVTSHWCLAESDVTSELHVWWGECGATPLTCRRHPYSMTEWDVIFSAIAEWDVIFSAIAEWEITFLLNRLQWRHLYTKHIWWQFYAKHLLFYTKHILLVLCKTYIVIGSFCWQNLFWNTRNLRAEIFRTLQRNLDLGIPRKGIARPQSQFPHSSVCERSIYTHVRPTPIFLQQNCRNCSQKHGRRNWDSSRSVLFLGIFCFEFSALCLCSVYKRKFLRVLGTNVAGLLVHLLHYCLGVWKSARLTSVPGPFGFPEMFRNVKNNPTGSNVPGPFAHFHKCWGVRIKARGDNRQSVRDLSYIKITV